MAEIISLGLNRPPALSYLIGESVLPAGVNETSYCWHTDQAQNGVGEEDLLYTADSVVWSVNGNVRKVFKFDGQERKVLRALLTNFPREANRASAAPPNTLQTVRKESHSHDSSKPMQRTARWGTKTYDLKDNVSSANASTPGTRPVQASTTSSRAIVIVLSGEVQIHYLSGPSHVVSLPFEVDEVFASYHGIVVQRKHSNAIAPPSSPLAPPAPPHTSFASQSQSFAQTSAAPFDFSGLANKERKQGLFPQLDALFRTLGTETVLQAAHDVPLFYSLADPLADFAAITHASASRVSRLSRLEGFDEMLVDYEPLEQDERIVYVSAQDELASTASPRDAPLLLMVTTNPRLQQITIWQCWYLRPQNLSTLLSQRSSHKAAKARQHGSVKNGSLTTGTITPGIRHRDRARESYAASARLPPDFASSVNSGISRHLQDDEESMASRMDPDYPALKQAGKVPKRVSSLLSRTEASTMDPSIRQTALGASFGGGGRRGPSISSFHDRRSFGSNIHRKGRGSTPGSVLSRSFGPGDDLTDSSTRLEDEILNDEYESIGRLISASHQSAGLDGAFGGAADSLRKELITRKLDSIPLHWQDEDSQQSTPSSTQHVKVIPLMRGITTKHGDRHMDLHILDKQSGNMVIISYRIRNQALFESDDQGPELASMPVPVMDDRTTISGVYDMEQISDRTARAVLYSSINDALRVIPAQSVPWSITLPKRMRVSDPTDVRDAFDQAPRNVGQMRTSQLANGPFSLHSPGNSGQITLVTSTGESHRLQLHIDPRNAAVKQILQVCQLVLRGQEGRCVQMLWCTSYQRLAGGKPCRTEGLDVEWEALIVTLFTLVAGSIGRSIKPRPHEHDTALSPHSIATTYDSQFASRDVREESRAFPSKPWDWLRDSSARKLRPIPRHRSKHKQTTNSATANKATISMSEYEAMARHFLHDIAVGELEWLVTSEGADRRTLCASKVMLALHLYREEMKLNMTFENHDRSTVAQCLAAIITQFGHWLGFEAWDHKLGTYYDAEGVPPNWEISTSTMRKSNTLMLVHYSRPPSAYEWLSHALLKISEDSFPTLEEIASIGKPAHGAVDMSELERALLPRLCSLQQLVRKFYQVKSSPDKVVEILESCGLTSRIVETFPEALISTINEAITRSQSNPPSSWPSHTLRFIRRDDLVCLSERGTWAISSAKRRANSGRNMLITRDTQSIFANADRAPVVSKTHEAERHAIVSLIFSEDRRLVDALRLINPTSVQVAECPPQPEWSEVEHLDQQKRVMNWVMVRTIALAPGFAMLHFESQRPLLSEHFAIKGFSTSCQMKPMNNTISADRSTFTEEKFGWAFFHSGVSSGLSISRDAKGIDTSWIVFNKPNELGNRHAGFLLALGINGHLRTLAKWLAFKYLTPKHNMTSIGLLLGLSASYIGTMDALITRMLSVHITRMLPPGAAELNVSPSTQTAGLMGIGLLYFNTQHRRMSEVMLSEIEHREIEDPGSTLDILRDESYRLAAGFALGLINLGQGRDLQGLRSMHILERLLNVAIGPRPVDLVHVVDKATAGAVIAVALIYMKTEDQSVAQKIAIPDTMAQLEHVRPDILLLRTVAKHLIMWSEITDEPGWVCANLPQDFAIRYYGQGHSRRSFEMVRLPHLKSEDIPFFNIITGLAWSLGLKFAGSGNTTARDEVLGLLKVFSAIAKQEAYYYDAKLARNTVRRCLDVLALSAATIMAGTGDLETFRHLRSLHGRIDPETSYGSHMAAHLAIGALFLGGGTYTFETSNFAIAALVCAFYPLFPSDVSDNRVHLQAFRHLWVFAAEPRCIVVKDIDTARPISMKLKVALRDGSEKIMTAPGLLPELSTIAHITTCNPTYWPVTLDFMNNPNHLSAFRRHQVIYVRRNEANEFSSTVFSSAMATLNDVQSGTATLRGMWNWILTLPVFRDFDQTILDSVLPPDARSAVHLAEEGTVYDTRLSLSKKSVTSLDRDALWNLRLLFEWAQDALDHGDGRLRWIGRETVDMLRARISQRMRQLTVAI